MTRCQHYGRTQARPFIHNGKQYGIVLAIPVGNTLIPDSNCQFISILSEFFEVKLTFIRSIFNLITGINKNLLCPLINIRIILSKLLANAISFVGIFP